MVLLCEARGCRITLNDLLKAVFSKTARIVGGPLIEVSVALSLISKYGFMD